MSTKIDIHPAQTAILRELLFHPTARFNELLKKTDLTSDHFNFHIKKLVELGLVSKTARGEYRLTPRGKEYANKLDTDTNTIERQPKVAVIFAIERDGKFVFQQRRKNPFYGFWGMPTGKVRWGEAIAETAAREAAEETGLTAEFDVVGLYHERVELAERPGEFSEDKLLFICRSHEWSGELIKDFEGGHNEWRRIDDILKNEKTYANDEAIYKIIAEYERGGAVKNWLIEDLTKYHEDEF
jgi:8-oxo-dGTP pyrophosphatase MutT (NUDIX family)